jgi:hypothetical protein
VFSIVGNVTEEEMRRPVFLAVSGVLALFISSLSASAASLTLGNLVGSPNSSDVVLSTVRTDIDLINPANASGTVDTASFGWSAVCSNAAKIKFFRRSGDTLTMIAERGPFNTTGSDTVTLSPPVDIQQGDLVGITELVSCGSPVALAGFPSAGYVGYSGDITGSVSLSAGNRKGDVLAVQATGSATESVSRVIPVVISTGGLFGSFFRTGVQVLNPGPGASTIAGRFVFHPAGVSGNLSDPSLPISVNAGQTISYTDILATMGQSGVGSMDLVLPDGSQVPVVVVRVYNDGGAAGTTGFTEDLVDPSGTIQGESLFGGATGYILGPSDTAHFRYNIGVRTLFGGATLTATVRDSSGTVLRTSSVSYPPTYLQQVDATSFLGAPLGNDQSIELSVSTGSAIIYGATADNTTNDPSIQFARVLFAIAAKAPPRK